jgi:hypothetical protein
MPQNFTDLFNTSLTNLTATLSQTKFTSCGRSPKFDPAVRFH